jgi:histidinol dehydrogenase
VKILSWKERGFDKAVEAVCQRATQQNAKVEQSVRNILDSVRRDGDKAVQRFTWQFDQIRIRPHQLQVSPKEIQEAYSALPKADTTALKYAARRIRTFHRRQRRSTWTYRKDGIQLGQMITPLDAVGVYVPGGKAVYPSSVLMNAIPAKVAGVGRVVMCTPTPSGSIHPSLLVAADIAGIDEIYRVGGVQAIGALAFGTSSIRPVDKIVGPGNLYVATAKRLVYGYVDIDMIAGPSELLVLADSSSNPSHVAADLLCEAEHDEEACVYLVTTSLAFAKRTVKEVNRQLGDALANQIAPEHLSLNMKKALDYLPRIRHAGAIFVGRYTPPAVADYVAGPNHVLPTGGSARFFSSLGVDEYVKRSNVVAYSQAALLKAKRAVVRLATLEGFDAHSQSMESRWT